MGLPDNSGLFLHSKWPHGRLNLITDVDGVKVGHVTLKGGDVHTGVTAVLPHGNIFQEKLAAGYAVLNGFGKSTGLVQIGELGTIETPIIMTNTLSVGTASEALTEYMLKENPDIGVSTGTVNCVVTECNDGGLNDIRGMHVKKNHVFDAISGASSEFEEGCVGGGTGMMCLGLKGGIGSSSRIVTVDGNEKTVGAIVMSNFGAPGHLVIGGDHIGERIKIAEDKEAAEKKAVENESADQNGEDILSSQNRHEDKGSIIMIIATDIPLSSRQLCRLSKRAAIALGRVGSYMGNGSGDIAISFSTGNRISHYGDKEIENISFMRDDKLDKVFEAAAEAVEEAIISSLYHAEDTLGIRGKYVKSLRSFL